MPKVFISSSAQDRRLAHEIAVALEQHGMNVWTSDRLPPGARIDQAIKDAVRDSDAYLVIQVPSTMKAFLPAREDYVDMEWDAIIRLAAREPGRKVLPVIPEGRTLSLLWRDWVPIRIGEPVDGDRLAHEVNAALAANSTEQEPFTAEERARQRQIAGQIIQNAERIEKGEI